MIKIYKMVDLVGKMKAVLFSTNLSRLGLEGTCRNCLKLSLKHVKKKKYFFIYRVVDFWILLPQEIAEAVHTSRFKKQLPKLVNNISTDGY